MSEHNKGINSTSSLDLAAVQDLMELIFEAYKKNESETSNVMEDTLLQPEESTTLCKSVKTSKYPRNIKSQKGTSQLNTTIVAASIASDIVEDTFLHPGKCATKVKTHKHAETSQYPRNITSQKGKSHLNTTIEASNASDVMQNTFLHPAKCATNVNVCKHAETSQYPRNIALQKGKSQLNTTIVEGSIASDVQNTFLHPGHCAANVNIHKHVTTPKCPRKIAIPKGKYHLNTPMEAEIITSNTNRNMDRKSCLSQCTSSLQHLNIKPKSGKHCNLTNCPYCGNKCQTTQEHEYLSTHSHQPVYSKKQKIIHHHPEVEDSDEPAVVTNPRHQLPEMDKYCFNERGHCCAVKKVDNEASREHCRGSLSQIPDWSSCRPHQSDDNLENIHASKIMHENIQAENSSETLTAYQDRKITDIVENMVSTLFQTLTETLHQPSPFVEQSLTSKVNKEKTSCVAGLPFKAPTILSIHDYQNKETTFTKSAIGHYCAQMMNSPCDESTAQTSSREIGQLKATPLPVSKVNNPLHDSSSNQKQHCSSAKVQYKQQLQSLKENEPKLSSPGGRRSNCSYVQRLRPNVRITSKHNNLSDFVDKTRSQGPPQKYPPVPSKNRLPDPTQNRLPDPPQNSPPEPDLPQTGPPSPALSDLDSLLMDKAQNGESVFLLELNSTTGNYSSTYDNGVINIVTHDKDSKNTQNQKHYSSQKFSVMLKDDENEREHQETTRDEHIYSFISEGSSRISNRGKGKKRRRKIPYTDEEVKNLLTGVSKMGKSWKQILCSYKFNPARTSVDLKDKYKRLMAGKGQDDSYYRT